jgi:type IV pilus assembly protein PilA
MRRFLLRLHEEEQGFTLIELMVVVMILGILLVMGLPTYIGVKGRFQDRGAQTDLRNTVLAARIMYTDSATFTSANETATGLVTIVPNQCYVATGTASIATGAAVCVSGAGSGSVSVGVPSAQQFAAARLSPSGADCFLILDSPAGTMYGKTTAANCTATWAAGNATATTPALAGW